MSPKDYLAAAALVRGLVERGHTSAYAVKVVRETLLQLFSADNASFKGDKFIAACLPSASTPVHPARTPDVIVREALEQEGYQVSEGTHRTLITRDGEAWKLNLTRGA